MRALVLVTDACMHDTLPCYSVLISNVSGAVRQVLGASKKAAEVRRAELLGQGQGSLAHALTQTCREHAAAWLRQPVTCGLVTEVSRGGADGEGSKLGSLFMGARSSILQEGLVVLNPGDG